MRIDTKACRLRADVADEIHQYTRVARQDVPALCSRVEALEAALADALMYARLCVAEEPSSLTARDKVDRAQRVLEGEP